MFRFSKEQSIVNVGGVKFGGQPGELPSVLCGTIFYHGHKIVEDEERGVFDRAAAERLISRQAELSEETGCPSVLHLYARSAPAFERYLDFAERVWSGPFIIDSADAATRAAAALLVSELGYADRAIYNSISLATEEKEAEKLLDCEIDSAIILAYNPAEPGVDGSLAILETGGTGAREGAAGRGPRNGTGQSAHRSGGVAPGQWSRVGSAFFRGGQGAPGPACRLRHSQCRLLLALALQKGDDCPENAAMRRQGPCSSWRQPTFCFTGPLKAPISSFPQRRWLTFSSPRLCATWRWHRERRILCTDWSRMHPLVIGKGKHN